MDNLIKINSKITSLELAEMADKKHFHLMRDIREMEQDWLTLGQSKFGLSSYTTSQNKEMPMYILTKTESLYIASKFDNTLRGKVILRWEELEEKQNKSIIPATYKDALLEIVNKIEVIEQKDKELKQQSETIQIQAPIVEYHNVVLDSSTAHTISQIAKELGMSAITLNKRLHDVGVQYRQGESWLLYAKHQGLDYVKTATYAYKDAKGETTTKLSTKWTEKGRKFIHNLYSEGKL